MKIAVISDIHGNKLAFDTVLDDINKNECDKIFCIGDIAMAGYDPNYAIEKCMELQTSMGRNFEIIQGNTDKLIANYSDSCFSKLVSKASPMAYALRDDMLFIKKENVEYLRRLPENKMVPLEYKSKTLRIQLVHGSPRRQDENIYPSLTEEEVEEITGRSYADIIFCGHTHLPCGYVLSSGKHVVNVGSVGRSMIPNRMPVYVILKINENGTFEIEHKFLNYDNKKVSRLIAQRGFKEVEKLAKMFLKEE